MSIEQTEKEWIIRISKKRNSNELREAINYLTYMSIVRKSKATQKDIDELLAQIKKERRPIVNELLKRAGIKHQ